MRRSQALITTAAVLLLTVGGSSVATATAAAPYPPPASGTGTADPSRVKQGHCTSFAGDGFAAGAELTIYDDDDRYGPTSADKQGAFRSRVCFGNDARVGDHVLKAEGANAQTAPTDPADREVTATVTVTGVEQSGNGNGNGNGKGKTDPAAVKGNRAASERGTDAVSPFTVATLALLLVPGVTGLLLTLERRHRRRRRTA